MPVKLLNLDDRTFADLSDEERLLIPRYARPWTDHNVSDPGIMLIELFAWLTETLLYRINRVSDASRMRLLELLGASFRPASPAVLELRLKWQRGSCTLPRGSHVQVDRGAARPVVFEILDDVTFTPEKHVRTITARQALRGPSRVLPQTSDGQELQLFRLEDGFIVTPPARRQRLPQITVDGQQWAYKPLLRGSKPDDTHFTYKPRLGSIVFGDGRTGAIPQANALITVTYQPNPDKPRLITDTFQSRGRPWQAFHLSRPLDLSEAARPGDLEPHLEILDSQEPEGCVAWEYAPSFLDMAQEAPQYTIEPWHNAIRFGNGAHGKVPAAGAQIRIDYYQTLGAEGNIAARGNTFSLWAEPKADKGPRQQVEHLKVLSWRFLSPGRDPTTLGEARDAVFALLEPGWRAVTADDFVSLVQKNHPSVARAVCLPGHDPDDAQGAARPGHVGVIAVPGPIGELIVQTSELQRIECLAPDGVHLVASPGDGSTWLWNVSTRQVLARLSRLSPARFVFSPSGRHLVVAPTQGAAALWDTGQGKRVAFLEQRPQSRADAIAAKARRREVQSPRGQQTLSQVVFDADGQRVATIAADDTASLWEVVDGAHRELGMALASVEPRFSPDGRLLAAALRDQAVAVWRVPGDREPAIVGLSAPASHLLFSPDSAQLAIATTDGCVYLERVRPSDGAVTEEMTLSLGQAAAELLFDRNGVRLAIRSANGEACLWSTRTGARMAELSQPTAVDRLVFSADGSRLATAHRDHTVRCWDARSGHAVVTLPGTAPVEALAFSPSGQRLTLVSTDAQHAIVLKAWDLRTDRARLVETLDRAKSKSAIVHMSGRWLAYGDEHLAHIWDLEQSRDITAVYADFDDPSVQATDWRLVTSDDPTHVQVGNHQPAVRLARGPYLWIISALDGQATKAAIQVLDAEHLYQIDATLAERRLVTSRHHIEGPIYTDVAIPLTVVRRSPAINPARVVKEIQDALTRFFDPLHGGPDGTGWPLGRPVYASEVYDVVEGVASVDHVTATKALRDTPISARSLVAFDIQVTVE